MKFRTILFAVTTVLTTSFALAANKTPLTYAEYLTLLAIHGQVLQKMDYEMKTFTKDVRPYTEEENLDYGCNMILVFKENLKFINQYPEYKNGAQVKVFINAYEKGTSQIQQIVDGNNKKCKGYVTRLPTSTKGTIPLVMNNNEANQKYTDYYSKQEQIINAYKNATDLASRKKQICALKDLSVTTEMYILLYSSMVKSEEGQKVLATIKDDGDFMRTKLSMDERCGI